MIDSSCLFYQKCQPSTPVFYTPDQVLPARGSTEFSLTNFCWECNLVILFWFHFCFLFFNSIQFLFLSFSWSGHRAPRKCTQSTKSSTEHGLGTSGLEEQNKRDCLVEFCTRNQLVVTNELFQYNPCLRYALKAPENRRWYKIDYILLKERFKNQIKTADPILAQI